MKDIAKDLGVSVITVSKVLRNHPDVGDETRKRVLARVKELNYQLNLAARSLVTGRTYLVGLVVPDLLHPFFAEIAKALSEVLRKSGYYLIVTSSDEDPELEEQEINQLLARRLDTLIIASCRTTVDLFFRIQNQKIPYVLIDRWLPGLSSNFVGVDDEAVGVLATRHLIDIGCKRIAHIRGPETSPGIRRLQGYKRALLESGMKIVDDYIIAEPKGDVESKQRGAEAMSRLLALKARPEVFSVSMTRWPWRRSTTLRRKDCAYPMTSPLWDQEIFTTTIRFGLGFRVLTSTAGRSGKKPRVSR